MICESFLTALRAKVSEQARSGRRFPTRFDRTGSGGRPREFGRCSVDRTGRTRPAATNAVLAGRRPLLSMCSGAATPVAVTPRCVRSSDSSAASATQTNGRVKTWSPHPSCLMADNFNPTGEQRSAARVSGRVCWRRADLGKGVIRVVMPHGSEAGGSDRVCGRGSDSMSCVCARSAP
jgi:hypothetical protein